ncbi:MAG TPA: hypothetical protein PKM40_01060, partial [Bacteroidia bacterium]|nr:hypothetical protein [Bacteroidia bacterium]
CSLKILSLALMLPDESSNNKQSARPDLSIFKFSPNYRVRTKNNIILKNNYLSKTMFVLLQNNE